MCRRFISLITFISILNLAAGSVVAGVAYPAPDAWWTYIYTGDAAGAALDGTWDHDNGSDQWDGSAIGSNQPGGVSALSENGVNYVRIQDPGDPRSNNMPDPSNRKIYFTHQLSNEIDPSLADEILSVHGITISFRARIATGGSIDQIHEGGIPRAWPAAGDGYGMHDGGKSIFTVHQETGGPQTISFALALAQEENANVTAYMGGKQGLLMNSLNGASSSGAVDAQDNEGTPNILELNPIEWHEFWITIESDATGTGTHRVKIYKDGSMEPSEFFVTAGNGSDETYSYIALGLGSTPQRGAIDVDFFAYKEGILTPADIYTASNPIPADGTMIEDSWVNLSWVEGASAVSHDVYLGDNYDDVSNAAPDSDVFRGNQTTPFYVAGFPGFAYPEGLVPGTTYYWRIDEVEADGVTKYKGSVWSFSVPPKTAYNPNPPDGAESVALDAKLSWTPGFGTKLHTVYFGDNYDTVNNATGGLPQGTATYTPTALKSEKVYYWRVDEFDGAVTHKGNIWAFATLGAAGNPQPSNGAAGVAMTAKLSWTPATTAASHDVYLGTDKDAVMNATTASPQFKGNKAKGSESLDPGKLAWHSDYYWRVDAVYNTGTVKGLVWKFTTADFITVDDFESYNDIDPPDAASNRIFDNWIDGFGTTNNGALVGNDLPPYAEQTIVHGGAQSMPYYYDNNLKTSEATLTLVSPRDWTEEGVGKLSLWVRGASANAADRIYVALNGTVIVYNDNPAATQTSGWNEWVIDLQAFADQGVNLANVNTISIGIGTKGSPAAGGTGKLYFDDIRLYRP